MKHIFDVDIAEKYGIHAAILLENLGYWIKQNEANETNFYDGYYWTFNSRRAYREIFPYMSERQIDTAFHKLIDDGLVITGNYNKLAYDRTLWYALTQKGKSILHFDGMEITKTQNATQQNVSPIPDINTNIKTDINTNKRFIVPTVEEVAAYCRERNNNVDPVHFVDYYTANDWKVGRNKMKDWKAAVRTWERNSFSGSNNNQKRGANGVLLDGRQTDDLDGIL